MNIEKEIFKRTKINFNKLIPYGFRKEKDNYIYSKLFSNNNFRADIIIDKFGIISGKVYDLQINEEYTNIRLESSTGSFVNNIKEEYKEILTDIKNKCTNAEYFITNQANRITKYIVNKYHNEPEFLWQSNPNFGVFRNENNNKWYGIIMNIDKSKITNSTGEVDLINVKLAEEKINQYIKQKGYYKAYHMNKKNWLTIILDDTISDEEIIKLIDESYENIKK